MARANRFGAEANRHDNHFMASAFVGIGSNVGDRRAYVEIAREKLAQLPDTRLVGFSPVYENPADSPVPQDDYLNAAAYIETELEPLNLLDHLQRIEHLTGRQPVEHRVRWGPRTLDLDLLLYDQRVISTDRLVVPHPMLHDRWWALKPLVDLDPDRVHPILEMTVVTLLRTIESTTIKPTREIPP